MINRDNHITVFEHQTIKLNQEIKGVKFDVDKLKALQGYYGSQGVPYFSLIHNGVRFNEHVGVIQVGTTVIEVLPKADKHDSDEKKWRDLLIDMLRKVGAFDVKSTSSSNLKIKPNSILDLYFELFINEVEYLLHNGLIKKYRKKEGNITALKGSLLFGKHLSQNLVHQERFYVRHTTYDVDHSLHHILYKTIGLLQRINTNQDLKSRIGVLQLHFPEMPDIKILESTFDKLVFNRKNQGYQKAIEIAKLLLLQFHPDLKSGRNDVLAIMFDMNLLWEQFVHSSLKKCKEIEIRGQHKMNFWKPDGGRSSSIRPDITITTENQNFVIDTKWKIIDKKPSPDDIRQMYAYHHYFKATKVALFYPGSSEYIAGKFVEIENQNMLSTLECGMMFSEVKRDIRDWQQQIGEDIRKWISQQKP